MKKPFLFLILLACAAALAGQQASNKKSEKSATRSPAPAKPSALDKTTMENYVRHLQIWDRSITVQVADPKPAPFPGFYEIGIHAFKDKASQDLTFYVSADGKHIIQGSHYETAENPYKPELDKLKSISAANTPNYGTTGAPVVIVEFSDFECPFCRDEAKSLRTNVLKDYPKEVHLYHLDMPIESIHPWARAAAIGGHCIYRQNSGAFWDYYDWIYQHQGDITADNLKARILEWAATKSNIDSLQLGRCMDNRETEADIDQSVAQAKSLDINSTPTFFVNGRRLSGAIEWANMKRVIDEEIEYQKTAKNAGEDCGCSMTLPSVGMPTTSTPTLGGLK